MVAFTFSNSIKLYRTTKIFELIYKCLYLPRKIDEFNLFHKLMSLLKNNKFAFYIYSKNFQVL
jgi:hypothetical protein